MRTKFYENLINSLEKIETVTLDEKHDKADILIAISEIIGKRGLSCKWNGKKWVVADK